MDPLTIAMLGSMGIKAVGDIFGTVAANKQRSRINSMAQGMFQNTPSPWETSLSTMMGQRPQTPYYDPNSWNIDPSTITRSMNAGNDGLMQFLRSDPAQRMQAAAAPAFDASKAFSLLAPMDKFQLGQQITGLRGGYGGLGQRFGSAAMGAEGMLRSNFGAQVDARNAGILQSGYENAAQRMLQATGQGMGLQLQGAQALGQQGTAAAQIAAAIAQANQQSQFRTSQLNLDTNQQNWMQGLQGIQAGYGMQQGRQGFNAQLLGIMAGLAPQQSPLSIAGQAGTDMSQFAMLLPYLRRITQGGGGGGMQYPMPNYTSAVPGFSGFGR